MRRFLTTRTVILWFAGLFVLGGCSGIDIDTYRDRHPVFNLFDYFEGTTRGWGIVENRQGRVLRQFVVDIEGSINSAGQLVLDEDFLWSDGETSRRVWTITRQTDGVFTGHADDVVGVAEGRSAGNALNWNYLLDLQVEEKTWTIRFDDWMYLQPDQVLINRATMSKFGFRVGDVTITFAKPE